MAPPNTRTAVIAAFDCRLRVTLSEILDSEGWAVLAAGGPAEVLQESAKSQPGIAIVGLKSLAAAGSFCVGMRIRYGTRVPIVGVHDRRSSLPSDAFPGSAMGPDDVLAVPFDIARLQRLLGRAEELLVRNQALRSGSERAVSRLRQARFERSLATFPVPPRFLTAPRRYLRAPIP